MKVNPEWISAPYEAFCFELRDGKVQTYIDRRVVAVEDDSQGNALNVYPDGVKLRRDFPKRYNFNKVEVPTFIE